MWRKNLSLDNMFEELTFLSTERKQAIAFAVYANISLNQIIWLKWSDSFDELDWRALFALNHIQERGIYVFVERIEGEWRQMFSIATMFDVATAWKDWESFSNKYRESTPIQLDRFGHQFVDELFQ